MAGVHGLCNPAPAFCQGDCAVVLSDGTVAEEGSPKDLAEKNGVYAHMVKLQTESQN